MNLAWFLADRNRKVQYIDCDVEEPNGHFFLSPYLNERVEASVMLPVVDQQKCTSCGECAQKCQFNAIARLPGNTLIFPSYAMAADSACMFALLALSARANEASICGDRYGWGGVQFAHGVLNVGEPMPIR